MRASIPDRPTDAPTFVDHCRRLARTQPLDRVYTWLRDGEVEEATLTFAELDAEARRVAVELDQRGLAGTRALLMYSPGLEFIIAFLGCLYARVAAVPLNAPRNERAAATMLAIARHAEPSILLTDSLLGLRDGPPPARALRLALPILATDTLPAGHGGGWRPASVDPQEPGLPPVHLGLHRFAQGGRGHPRQPDPQRADDPRGLRPRRATRSSVAGCPCSTTWGWWATCCSRSSCAGKAC